ncbi:MAG: hypothetical protein WCO33_01445 [bacterium]
MSKLRSIFGLAFATSLLLTGSRVVSDLQKYTIETGIRPLRDGDILYKAISTCKIPSGTEVYSLPSGGRNPSQNLKLTKEIVPEDRTVINPYIYIANRDGMKGEVTARRTRMGTFISSRYLVYFDEERTVKGYISMLDFDCSTYIPRESTSVSEGKYNLKRCKVSMENDRMTKCTPEG